MPRRKSVLASMLMLVVCARVATAQQTRDFAPYMIGDRNGEVSLARTAAPKFISDSATVLVLTRKGYVEAERGTNGFTCFVARSFAGRVDDSDFWNVKTRAPHCLNPPAVRTILPEMVKRAEWVLAGVAPAEIWTRTLRMYGTRELPMPEAGAMAYMLSRRQLLAAANSPWHPHLMFYYPSSVSPMTFGAAGFSAPVINGSAGDEKNPVMTVLIPVPQWSDGTPAVAKAGH